MCRKNDPTVKLKDVPRQQAPEEGRVPTERTQPVASVAHVDQDEVSQRVSESLSGGRRKKVSGGRVKHSVKIRDT